MRLTQYGRNPNQRKAYVHQPDLLLVGVDVRKATPSACLGTQTTISCRTLAFPPTRAGCRRFAQPLRVPMVKNGRQHILIAMEPSGLSWQALYARLNSCGYEVCLVHCQAVRTKRKTMQDGTRKTDEKEAASVVDLRRQGQCCLPVARAPALRAASRLMPRPLALKKRGSPLRTPLRAALHRAFPELPPVIQALTPPTAVRFLQVKPPPESILRHGRRHCLEQWQPRRRWGQWHREKLPRLSALATARIGLKDPYGMDECESKALAQDRADALTKQPLWLTQALE